MKNSHKKIKVKAATEEEFMNTPQTTKIQLTKTTFEEDAEKLDLIRKKMESASIEQLRATVMGLCENLVSLTANCPNEETFMVAAMHILDAALDENESAAVEPYSQASN